jgi:UDP-N-acetylmuramate dehydrogenase
MITRRFLEELRRLGLIRFAEPLSAHTTWGVGGPADVYMTAKSGEQLRRAFAIAREHAVPVLVLGAGSNILVGDEGFRGLVIENRARQVQGPILRNGIAIVRAESGAPLAALARRLGRAGWEGLEWAVGIPGTLGGAVVYNAGAYGGCLADVLVCAVVGDAQGCVQTLRREDLALGYRGSALTRGLLQDVVVTEVELQVWPGQRQALEERMRELEARRRASQPRGRSAGSVFKNPPQRPAWWYVDQVGLRGYRIGNAQFSLHHANFIINLGQARAADIKALIDLARGRVRERFGIDLELEVALVGEGF